MITTNRDLAFLLVVVGVFYCVVFRCSSCTESVEREKTHQLAATANAEAKRAEQTARQAEAETQLQWNRATLIKPKDQAK